MAFTFRSMHQFKLGLVMLGLLFLASCSSSAGIGAGATQTPTITASDILAKAASSGLKDATFSIQLQGSASTSVTGNTPTLSGTGTGKVTTSPKRSEITFDNITIPLIQQTTSAQLIVDGQDLYLKISTLPKWIKTSTSAIGDQIGNLDILDFSKLQDMKLNGLESLNNTPAYHLQGTYATTVNSSGQVSNKADLWLRTKDYYPLKIQIQQQGDVTGTGTSAGASATSTLTTSATPSAISTPTNSATPTGGQALVQETITFTQWNTGTTITLPNSSQTSPTGF
jgi:hypothetical protein